MGYTHYFNFQNKDKNEARILRWDAIKKQFAKLYTKENWVNTIQFEDDIGAKYRFDSMDIQFNGIGDNAHETFFISRYGKRNGDFKFCKTANKDYDIPVTCLLILLKYHYGTGFSFGSDGVDSSGIFYDSFIDALSIIKKHLGLNLKLTVREAQGIIVQRGVE